MNLIREQVQSQNAMSIFLNYIFISGLREGFNKSGKFPIRGEGAEKFKNFSHFLAAKTQLNKS